MVGGIDCAKLGSLLGLRLGSFDGLTDGIGVGICEGWLDGDGVGPTDGFIVG